MNDNKGDLSKLQTSIGYCFRNTRLLAQAMIHSSYAYEHAQKGCSDNEILEFLGDAVLDLVISHLLVKHYPDCDEGELSRLRSAMVNERELAKIARYIDLGNYLRLGRGEEQSGGRNKSSLLADSFEALLGAVYLDGGLEPVMKLVSKLFKPYLEVKGSKWALKVLDRDYKTRLQEFAQARWKLTPVYTLEGEDGPDHDKRFHMNVMIGGRIIARATGRSKKEAQQRAAREALTRIGYEFEEIEGQALNEPS